MRAGGSVIRRSGPEPRAGREMLHLSHRPGPDDPDTRRSLIVSRPWADGRVCLHALDLDAPGGPEQVSFAVAPEDLPRLVDHLQFYASLPTAMPLTLPEGTSK